MTENVNSQRNVIAAFKEKAPQYLSSTGRHLGLSMRGKTGESTKCKTQDGGKSNSAIDGDTKNREL